jgi:hypothetical protein
MSAQHVRFPINLYPTPIATPWEAWRLGWMVSQFWLTAAQKVLDQGGWLTGTDSTCRSVREWQRLWSATMSDNIETAMEWQRAGSDLLLARLDAAKDDGR